ncbi:MAG: cytochrome c maturation protein CcmE [Actinomycetota bacterium]|nr:cytochrome c maturation protein CcmE [Actinomycetota bacterium]
MGSRKKRTIITIILILFFLAALLYTTASSFNYYRTPSEVSGDPSLSGKRIKVAGRLSSEIAPVVGGGQAFTITDDKTDIRVTYDKSLPPSLGAETEIIVEGTFDGKNGLIEADLVLTKCPSKYSSK